MNHGKTMIGLVGGLLLVAGSVMFSGQALAADKIGVIDVRKAVSLTTAGQKFQSVAEQKAKALNNDLKKDNDALVALQKEGEKKGSAWSEAVKKEKATEFQKKARDMAAKKEAANEEMKKMYDDQMKPLETKLLEAAKKIAKEEGYTYILRREALIVVPDSADISDKVAEEVNKTLK